jgi:hypothetical protein
MLVFLAPPAHDAPVDANGDNVYIVKITAWDADGQSTVQTMTVTVTKPAPNITSTKTVIAVSLPTEAFDCLNDVAIDGADIFTAGVCISYRIDLSNPAEAGPAGDLVLVDNVPTEVVAVAIQSSAGFDTLSLSENTITGQISSFAPGASAFVKIRALIQ